MGQPGDFSESRQSAGTLRSTSALDREIALSRVGGDLDLLKEIGQLFLDDADRMLSAISTAVEAGDAQGLDRSAHTLKGCVSNFGAIRLYESAFALETMGRNRQLAHAETQLRLLEREIERLKSDLRQLAAEG